MMAQTAEKKGPWFGHGLPYEDVSSLPGRMIVVEGVDGVGRSTQVEMLSSWIESQGFGVINTGWTRSKMMGPTIDNAKAGHTLDARTFTLLYAADFADRLEFEVIPALKAGFVVVADRYVYTAFARDVVRGQDRRWVRDLFGFAVVPNLVLYLDITAETLMPRILNGGGMTYWESGMDLRLADNIYDSCLAYQKRLITEFRRMAKEFSFVMVDASGTREATQRAIRKPIQKVLDEMSREREG
jgi:dTMP kinase